MQKLKTIEIKNFKSIRDATIKDCKRVNIFIGPPNVGKSNILEGIGLFGFLDNDIVGRIDLKDIVRIQELSQLFINGDITSEIEIKTNNFFIATINHLEVGCSFRIHSTEEIKGTVAPIVFEDLNQKKDITLLNANIQSPTRMQISESNLVKRVIAGQIEPIRRYLFNLNHISKSSNSLNYLSTPFGDNISKIIFSVPNVKKEIIELFDRFGLSIATSSESVSLKLLKKIKDGSHFILDFQMIADTLQRLIFHKVAILSNKNSVLLLEEPEAHCYEPYIMEITNAIKNDLNNNQFFIVTQSQYVIDELLKEESSRNDTSIYLVGLDKDEETIVKLLDAEISADVYKSGLNVFFNFESLWEEN